MLFNQRRTKIGFLMLRFDIEGFELAPNEMRQSRRDHGVEHAHPKHIAGNRDAPNFGGTGERPQDDGKTPDREQGIVKTHREVHGVGICQDTSKKLVRSLFIPEEPQQGLCPYASLPQDIFLT